MHIHNVADYAPAGHRLMRTDYAGGATLHVFASPEGKELVCEVIAKDADEERAQLEAFRAKQDEHRAWVDKHAPGIGEGVRAVADEVTPGQVMRRAIVDAADEGE